MRLLYDLRPFFEGLTNRNGNLQQLLLGKPIGVAHKLPDLDAVFRDSSNEDLLLSLSMHDPSYLGRAHPCFRDISIKIGRNDYKARLVDSPLNMDGAWHSDQTSYWRLRTTPSRLLDMEPLLSAFRALANTVYFGPYRNPINHGASPQYFDLTVGQAFIKQWRSLKSGNSVAQRRAAREITREIKRVFGMSRLEISASAGEANLLVDIGDETYLLDDVGAGIAQFVMLLVTAATRSADLILVDEPELHLHPALQRQLLLSLSARASMGVVYSTHNLALALDVSDGAYSLSEAPDGTVVSELDRSSIDPALAAALGVQSLRLTGRTRMLLVEGPHDSRVLHELLAKTGKLDTYALVSLGGSSGISHHAERILPQLATLGLPLHAIIDSERDSPGAKLHQSRLDFLKACKKNKVDVKVLDRRATENYFTDRAVKAVDPNLSALAEFQSTKGWPKGVDYQIARRMSVSELSSTDLGVWLDQLPS